MQKALAYFSLVMLFVLGALLGFWLRGLHKAEPQEPIVQTDTLYVRDTIRIDMPIPVPKPVYLPSDTVRLVTVQHDTVEVLVPMEQKHYQDSLYDAWVSGYKPALDSLHVYPVTKFITTTVTIPTKTKRWGIGVHAGVGVQYGTLRKQMDVGPYVGVGISYNILTF